MLITELLLEEFKREAILTKKILGKVPFDNPEWKPHEKSFTIQRLSSHIAEIPNWMGRILEADELDMNTGMNFARFYAKDNAELLQKFSETSTGAIAALQKSGDEALKVNWSMRKGEKIFYTIPKIVALRNFVFSHTVHHRGQLSVYLRLINIPVPGMYGPSADEK